MEVHPPRHAINNWRDFVLHMATIVLGLLIAISLEQSVEWLHRSEKRRQLQGDLRQEMRANDAQLGEDIKFCSADAEWCLDQAQRIQAALHANNGASLTYEEARLKVSDTFCRTTPFGSTRGKAAPPLCCRVRKRNATRFSIGFVSASWRVTRTGMRRASPEMSSRRSSPTHTMAPRIFRK